MSARSGDEARGFIQRKVEESVGEGTDLVFPARILPALQWGAGPDELCSRALQDAHFLNEREAPVNLPEAARARSNLRPVVPHRRKDDGKWPIAGTTSP